MSFDLHVIGVARADWLHGATILLKKIKRLSLTCVELRQIAYDDYTQINMDRFLKLKMQARLDL